MRVVLALLAEVSIWQSRGLLLVCRHLLQVLFFQLVDLLHLSAVLLHIGGRCERCELLSEQRHLQGSIIIISGLFWITIVIQQLLVNCDNS